jgi:hypothetical protein
MQPGFENSGGGCRNVAITLLPSGVSPTVKKFASAETIWLLKLLTLI